MITPQIERVADFQMQVVAGEDLAVSIPSAVFGADLHGTAWFPLLKEPAGTTDSFDWDSIHRAVQEILGTLASWVLSRAPATAWKSGRSSARAFPLFSYRVFYRLDGNDYDPVIVGVTVSLEGSIARVSGDISGDESGRVYFDEGCSLEVPSHQEAVFDAACYVAYLLVVPGQIVLDAISDRDFQVVEP
ncbi:MAG: hypothetical protein ACLQU5_34715 [Isosphaeraceae bacterium]